MQGKTNSHLAARRTALRGKGPMPLQGTRAWRTMAGVEHVDDSRSGFPDDALSTLPGLGKPLVWIADASRVPAIDGRQAEFLHDPVDAVVCHGKADPAKAHALEAGPRLVHFTARELAVAGGRVLYSPACPCAGAMADQARAERRMQAGTQRPLINR